MNNYNKGNGKNFNNTNKPYNNEQPDIGPFLKEITKENLPELINKTADNVAKCIKKGTNSYTQIRKFYDELLSLQNQMKKYKQSKSDKESFEIILPMIYLVKSKAAYAKGKGNINHNLESFFKFYIEKITDEETLKYFMLYFEAVLGYLRSYTK